ncbi:MAG: type I restriction endonuclease subunit R [Lautropia sp.]|nr:type I restriction endonuclease subunit R [Lautropia sp.]
MTRNTYSEDKLIQKTTADRLERDLGWTIHYAQDAEDLGPESLLGRHDQTEVILKRDVLAALKRLNPGLPDSAYRDALTAVIHHDPTQSLVRRNQDKYTLLREGVLVQYQDKNQRTVQKRLKLIDFNKPDRNHFVAVRELWIKGSLGRKRPDILGFINGLPLIFIELKRHDVPIEQAYTGNLADYKHTIPALFDWNALVIVSNGVDARYGSITAPWEHFYQWKRLDEDDPEPARNKPLLDILLPGLLHKATLLDIIENFTLFDSSEGSISKVIPRNHQYLGVNRVIGRLTSTDPKVRHEVDDENKLGVFWHTQGSGKSYSMVFLTEKIHRKISAAYTFVIVTDRNELDDQIASTYSNCGIVNTQDDQAQSSSALRKMLGEQNRRYIFGLIQKYQQSVTKPYSTRSDIIVISDEAHRTQYGKLALNMRKGLPHAKFLGMTGTPLINSAEAQQTRDVFGDYVSIYDFQRAVADKATLPLFYENTGEALNITDPRLGQRITEYIEQAKAEAPINDPWTDEKEEKLIRALQREYTLLTATQRLDTVAQHFVDHFHQRWQIVSPGGGKAMLVCVDKITCVKMYDLIQEKWQQKIAELEKKLKEDEAPFLQAGRQPNQRLQQRRAHLAWMEETECCVVVSPEQGEIELFSQWQNHRDEPLDIKPHRDKMVSRPLEKQFKTASHPFRIAIVCAMWLTGFDVKCLTTLYLDKPMQGHSLMQAIARVNRVGLGKKNGLIIDYNGMVRSLREALAKFAQGDRAGTGKGEHSQDTVQDNQLILLEYEHNLLEIRTYLQARGYELERLLNANPDERLAELLTAANCLNEQDEYRESFLAMMGNLDSLYRSVFPHKGLFVHADTHEALSAIRNQIARQKISPDITPVLSDLHRLIELGVASTPITAQSPGSQYDLSRLDVERLKEEFEKSAHKATIAVELRERIEERLQRMIRNNPQRVDFQERYQEIVDAYNRDKSTSEIQQIMDQLFGFYKETTEEERRYQRENLDNEEQLAVFDMLAKESLGKKDRERIKQVARDLLQRLKQNKLNIDHWQAKASAQADIKLEILNHLYTHLPEDDYDADDIESMADSVFIYLRDQMQMSHEPRLH